MNTFERVIACFYKYSLFHCLMHIINDQETFFGIFKWIRRCLCITYFLLNALKQWGHCQGLSPVCISRWRSRTPRPANHFKQYWHWNFFFFLNGSHVTGMGGETSNCCKSLVGKVASCPLNAIPVCPPDLMFSKLEWLSKSEIWRYIRLYLLSFEATAI